MPLQIFFTSCHCPPPSPSAPPSHLLGQLPHLIFPFTLFSQLKIPSGILSSCLPFSLNNWDLCALSSGHPISPHYFPPSLPPITSPLLPCFPPLEAVCSIFKLRADFNLPGAISDQPEALFFLPCRSSVCPCFPSVMQ